MTLECHNNNRSETMLECYLRVIKIYGLLGRVSFWQERKYSCCLLIWWYVKEGLVEVSSAKVPTTKEMNSYGRTYMMGYPHCLMICLFDRGRSCYRTTEWYPCSSTLLRFFYHISMIKFVCGMLHGQLIECGL